ncbi:MAG: hypothetical protein QM784_18965 [Polyangiaceae bacterium]
MALHTRASLSFIATIRFIVGLLVCTWIQTVTTSAIAADIAAPIGGSPVLVPEGRVVCGDPGDGWQLEGRNNSLRPPTDPALVGKTTTIRVATTLPGCLTTKETLTIQVTGPQPVVDRRSIDLWVDEGRIELRGTNLEGTRLEWEAKGERGSDTCTTPAVVNGQPTCSYSVRRGLEASPTVISLRLFPAGSPAQGVVFGSNGQPLSDDATQVVPARIIVNATLIAEERIDLSSGEARISLRHPEAVAAAACDNGRCEVVDNEVRVRATVGSARTLSLRLKLTPRIFAKTADAFSQNLTIPLEVTYCPVSVVSPPPPRDTEDTRVVVRLDARCGVNAESIRWTANGNPVNNLETETREGSVYVLLGLGRLNTERVTLAALRGTAEHSVIGLSTVTTVPALKLKVTLHLTGFGEIDFMPTNRDAILSVTAPNLAGKLVALPMSGVYTVTERGGRMWVRGDAGGGYVLLQFALRDDSLPGPLAKADLAHVEAPVQHALREVNVPTPIGIVDSTRPVAEVLCTDARGRPVKVVPGIPLHIPFAQRDGCRLILHREHIPSENGEQRLNVTVDVTSAAGAGRPEGHLAHRLKLRHGREPRVIWLRGVQAQFDRINVQLTHVTDESQYLQDGGERFEIPAGQWTVVVENTSFRLYATAAIPVQLFRFSNSARGAGSGPLALNLGVLTRLTWITQDGAEGILGLESGVMGMGLSTSNTRQLNLVGGLGLRMPLGGSGASQASVNIHAWAAYRLGDESAAKLDANGNVVPGEYVKVHHWSFIFGPSFTFGNLGFDL